MFDYVEPVYRPPSEAYSLILQATIGCSFNRCSFCSMYRSKQYRVRPLEEIFGEIEVAARMLPEARKVFLADGDAFTLPTEHLLAILDRLRDRLPDFGRAGAYAWPINIYRKSDDELRRLREAGLAMAYVGLETGADRLLRKITKGSNAKLHGEAIDRLRGAGIRVSATTILGLGGRRHRDEHVAETAELVSASPPNFLSTLQLGLAPEISDEFHRKFGDDFEPQDDLGMLTELRDLILAIEPRRPIIFRSNHASNALALAGNLPRDRRALAGTVEKALGGRIPLRPPGWRGY
jgi:radical SAM superfamily enzyme YgiQ (UPF0313 family)